MIQWILLVCLVSLLELEVAGVGACLIHVRLTKLQHCPNLRYVHHLAVASCEISLPMRHAYTVNLRFSRSKPGHWWLQLELPEMLILVRLVLEMSILEKLRSAEQVWRCHSQCSLESMANRKNPQQVLKMIGHGKSKRAMRVLLNGKWNIMEPGVLVRTIQTKKSFCQKPLSLGVIHRSQLSGSTVPTFAISGAYFDQGHGVSKHRMKRLSRNKGTTLSLSLYEMHHAVLE